MLVGLGQAVGRFSAAVKGSRGGRGRTFGLLEPPVELEARLRPGRSLFQLSQPTLRAGFSRLKGSLEGLLTAGFLARLFLACLPEGERAEGPYGLLSGLFEELDSGNSVVEVALRGQDRLLAELGLSPHLESCLHCQKATVAGFSADEGGMLCSGCYTGTGFSVDRRTHQGLLRIRAGDTFHGEPWEVREIGRVYKEHFQCHLGVPDSVFKKVLPARAGEGR